MTDATKVPLNAVRSKLFTSVGQHALKSSASWFTVAGLGVNLVSDSIDFRNSKMDRFHYAAALTVDTGATVGAAMLGGAIAGGVADAIAGAPALGIGAVPGAIIGGIDGAVVAGGLSIAFYQTGGRDYVVDKVTVQYSTWVGP